jgi:hypothetical protein
LKFMKKVSRQIHSVSEFQEIVGKGGEGGGSCQPQIIHPMSLFSHTMYPYSVISMHCIQYIL